MLNQGYMLFSASHKIFFEVEKWKDLLRQRRDILFLKMPLLSVDLCWINSGIQWPKVLAQTSLSPQRLYCFGWSGNSEQNHFWCLWLRIPKDIVVCNTMRRTKGNKEEMERSRVWLAVVFIFPVVLLKRIKIQEGMNMCILEILEFHCHRIFLNGYINNFILDPKQNQIYICTF